MKRILIAILLGILLCLGLMTVAGCSCGSCEVGCSGCGDEEEKVATKETIDGIEYTVYEGHYYLLVEESLTWHEAEFACEQKGGYLAVISSYKENDAIKSIMAKRYKNVWLGATDEKQEGVWQWVTGEEFARNGWNKDEPNGTTSENYMGFYEADGQFGWNDFAFNAGSVVGYICEWDSKEDIGSAKYRCVKSISTVEELKALNNNSGIYYLTNDLDLASESNWTPITNFNGLLMGQNYTIKNLTINSLNVANLGLFDKVKSGVKDLVVENVRINAVGEAGHIGAVAGISYGNIENITVSGSINAPYYDNVGGVVGENSSGTVKNCTNNIKITARKNVGGVVGMATIDTSGAIDNNINEGEINASENVGGIVGGVKGSEIEGVYTYAINNCTNSANITVLEGKVGGIIGTLSGLNKSWTEIIEGEKIWFIPLEPDEEIVHDIKSNFTIESCKNSGNITAPSDYFDAGGIIGYGDNVVSLDACENTGDITGGTSVGGFVGYSPNTNIKANNFVNKATITGKGKVGGFAGQAGLIENAINEGEIVSTHYYIETIDNVEYKRAWVGGVAGYATGIISCENKSNITVSHVGEFVGGVAGYVYQTDANKFTNAKNSGNIKGQMYVGGVVGYVTCSGGTTYNITFSENNGNITAVGGQVGGIIGEAMHGSPVFALSTLKNTGKITGGTQNDVGGIIGKGVGVGSISVCENKGDITSEALNVGGIAGYVPNATIRSTGIPQNASVSGVALVGGFAGTAKIVEDSINNGVITASTVSGRGEDGWVCLGGVVGQAQAVYRCVNNADINYTGNGARIGGIVGELNASTMEEFCVDNENNGDIIGANCLGGIVGWVERSNGNHKLDNNKNKGKISGGESIGGIVGKIFSEDSTIVIVCSYIIINCSNTAIIEGTNYIGGIVGLPTDVNLSAEYMDTNTTTFGNKLGA